MYINPLIFRDYDIRGIVAVDLDSDKVTAIGKAYGTLLNQKRIRKIVVGRDSRLSSDSYHRCFIAGVISTGIDVIDIGEVMTQMVYFAQYLFHTQGGAMLTASHNPANYNGFKLAIGYSQTTGPDEVDALYKIVTDVSFAVNPRGIITYADVDKDYLTDLLKKVPLAKPFRVVIDSHHGTAGLYVPEILRRSGCEVIERYTTVDGSFPDGTPDPTDKNLMDGLAQSVLENRADIGFAFDGDGDRVGLVDEKGHIIWNDVIVALFAQEILSRFPGSKIVFNALCSQVVPQVIRKNNGIPVMWRTGHAYIKAKIAQEKAIFGGELSGHFFFTDNNYGYDDGSYAALRVLDYLSKSHLSLSQLCSRFPRYISSPEIKIGCPDDQKVEVVRELCAKFRIDFPQALITDNSVIPGDDGVRADFDDGMIVFRYSQNGPYVTTRFEAKNADVFDHRRSYVYDLLHNYFQMIWDDELCVNLAFLERGK